MSRVTFRILVITAMFLAALPAYPQERGACIRLDVPFAITLPDGSRHEPGELSLCVSRQLTPVTVLHVLAVDGMPLGLYLSRAERSEGADLPRPMVAFVRNDDGSFGLSGYVTGHRRSVTFRFDPARAVAYSPRLTPSFPPPLTLAASSTAGFLASP